MNLNYKVAQYFILLLSTFLFNACKPKLEKTIASQSPYLSVSGEAYHVGKEACKSCHQDKYETFSHTGMGQSFDTASTTKSKGDFIHTQPLYDSYLNLYYKPFWKNNLLYVKEYRLVNGDTTHSLTRPINYIIGSGQHTNSHITIENGYLFQAPFTYYTQKGVLDFPPGFENGANSRFSRALEIECLSCHNAYPKIVDGSLNKYTSVPKGIDCERCHGAGSIHVAQKEQGIIVDTDKEIDYSIVNPSKLPIDLQFDICQRCHLQGNTILKEGKTFYDFKPGMPLHSIMETFLPRYNTSDKDFIMASHADRLKMSPCFIKSIKKTPQNKLKPYKDALTCITCHDPHVSIKNIASETFNSKCTSCHLKEKIADCSEQPNKLALSNNNCVSCHMPKSTSIDIPHVTVHDHYIRKHMPQKEQNKIKQFIALYCANNPNTDRLTRAKAYLNQYEKFDPQNKILLDSAAFFLKSYPKEKHLAQYIKLYFLKQTPTEIINLIATIGQEKVLQALPKVKFDNTNAWTAYYIANAFEKEKQMLNAIKFYEKASTLAPYYYEFTNKLASSYLQTNKIQEAKAKYTFLVKENPSFATAQNNLGYIYILERDFTTAVKYINQSINLDPNYELAYLNRGNCFLQTEGKKKAINYLENVLKNNKSFKTVEQTLGQLKAS